MKRYVVIACALLAYVACGRQDESDDAWMNPVAVAGVSEGNDSYTKLLLHMDGTNEATSLIDSSSSNYTITVYSTARLDTSKKEFGTASLSLNGSSDYITVPDGNDWFFGTSAFTIDLWCNFKTTTTMLGNLFAQRKQGSEGTQFAWDYSFPNALYFGSGNPWVAYNVQIKCSWLPSTNVWYHVALVRLDDQNSSNSWRMFIDGTNQPLTLVGGAWSGAVINASNPMTIGRNGDYNGQYFAGWIDEMRVSKGIARWTNNFTPPTRSYGE